MLEVRQPAVSPVRIRSFTRDQESIVSRPNPNPLLPECVMADRPSRAPRLAIVAAAVGRCARGACLATLVACGTDRGPAGGPDVDALAVAASTSVCHISGARATALQLDPQQLDTHLRHGDYVMALEVGDGNVNARDIARFSTISAAIAAARTIRTSRPPAAVANCPITITVAPGTYRGTVEPTLDPALERLPLLLDFSGVTLRGALQMSLDDVQRATGIGRDLLATTLLPIQPLSGVAALHSQPLIVVNSQPSGAPTVRVAIEGFVFQSGHAGSGTGFGGQGILALRVRDLTVRGNRFEGGFSEPIDLRASEALVERNHLAGGSGACDLCLAGPGVYRAMDNRLVAGSAPGILVTPATLLPVPPMVERYILPADATVEAALINNEVRDHLHSTIGAGIRLGAVGVGAPNVHGRISARLSGNTLAHNTFGLIVEAAHPTYGSARKGDIAATLDRNQFIESCQRDLMVSLTPHTTGLGLANAPSLRQSTFRLSLGQDLRWQDAWYGNPDGFDNSLIVDDARIPYGSRAGYDAKRGCGR